MNETAEDLIAMHKGDVIRAHEYAADMGYPVPLVKDLMHRRRIWCNEGHERVAPLLRKGWDEFFAAGGTLPK